ncbi:MAG TPA: hypothetical protein DDX89_02005 [Candidatus Omnitrophica bacterium]|nr:MAG: hypothetical protein A2Z92_03015 [Omnitrophica WOR_2 bacterium GWA2_63_20]OGX17169.1 MAG: hypothetical protein A2105_01140 [Omnitrophica WOR_2 bacterium GWF2_63_9]OGX34667.1 MAG: hypothetical protein A3B73_05965 [Omnitrophica WOR_2 bacterium RIFCSPHIGHO2_02_FULL_63_39]OGX44634.1 MAG: hypothetical protein A3I71_07030 [Omnitrophica WOR_2 bacterium RIFCSPLOWO2_02_FULL_63_16]OGX49204.1 MAG: hypothetical protein A3G88_04255 [Omnitrophica WOR_2 bacterium RIFCSPLOWO2_12_FULL_63_16]HBH96551.1 
MSYTVVLHPKAKRELGRLPHDVFQHVDPVIWSLRDQPRPMGVKKLEGQTHRVRIGNWRVIYAILDDDQRVVILRVTRRSERTYKDLW